MKMKDLEKLAEKADEILKKREEKRILLKKACEAGLIKKPEYSDYLSYGCLYEAAFCPECKKRLIEETCATSPYSSVTYFHCPNCEYEYAH